ncbi:MAG TPA: hypothetical protein VHW44_03225 [Pseudonocardiaceae bacterium]|jgi:hypothetical protein|nr:hypothetical protein [Pseudonocardiaceae bacterium]
MSEPRRALVLHLSSGGDPLVVSISVATAEAVGPRLADLILGGKIETITAANGTGIAVNFSQVLAAHVDINPGLGQIYGSVPRER